MLLNSRNRVKWLFPILSLLAMMLISPLPPSVAKSALPGHTSQLALKCLVGSYCGDDFDVML
jgi:hypothetical protein